MPSEHWRLTADFIFLDPPYEMEEAYQQALEKLSTSGLLKDESIVIAEHQKKFEPGEIFGSLRRYRKLVQGDAVLSFYRLAVNLSIPNLMSSRAKRGISVSVPATRIPRRLTVPWNDSILLSHHIRISLVRRTIGCCISCRSFFTWLRP